MGSRAPLLFALGWAAGALFPGVARADAPPRVGEDLSRPSATSVREAQTMHAPTPKRAVPDYDGRGRKEAKPSAGLWLLRVPLAPLYGATELVVRRPLAAFVPWVEKVDLPRKLYDFFFFAPRNDGGVLPTVFGEFGFEPSVGVYAFWNDAFFVKGNAFRAHYGAWPPDWIAGTVADEQRINDHVSIRARVSGFRRPDNVFYGLGPSSLQSSQSRFTEHRFDASISTKARGWRSSGVDLTIGVRKVTTARGSYGSDPSVEEAVAEGLYPSPPGYGHAYTNPYVRALLTLDTRAPRARSGSGARLQAEIEHASSFEQRSGFLRWGGAATGFLDLNGHGRVLSASIATAFVDPLGEDPVPFTELVSLGGDVWMRGFYHGRLVDRSTAAAALQYTWPVAIAVDATIEAAVGNAFGPWLEGFQPKLLRLSGAAGLSLRTEPPLELLVGFGTETFESGAKIDAVRFTIGVPRAFIH